MKAGLLAVVVALASLAACDTFVTAATRMQRAEKAVADNDYGRAIVELRNVVQSQPDNLQARAKLVEALLLNNDLNAIDAELAQLVAKSNGAAEVQALLARVYIAKRDFKGLLDALDNGQLHLDQNTEHLRRAQALLGLRNGNDAEALLQQVLNARPNDAEAQLIYAQSLAAKGAVEPAIAALDKLLSASPNDARAWAAKGYLHAQQGMTLQATRALSTANRNAGGQLTRLEELSTLALLVEQQLLLGNVKAAQNTQQQLSGFFPSSPVTQLAAGEVSFAQANYAEVVPQMQKLLTTQTDLHAARLLLARALAAQGNSRQAESELQRLISAVPRNATARVALAQVEMKLGQNTAALEVLAPVAAVSNDQQIGALLAAAQTAVAGSSKDLNELVTAAKREPANEPLRVAVASTLLRAGQTQQAIEFLRDVEQSKFSARRVPLLLRAISMQSNLSSARSEAERIGADHAHEPSYLAAIGTFFSGEKDYATATVWLERALSALRSNAGAKPDDVEASVGGELMLVRQLIAVDLAGGHKAEALARAQAYRKTQANDIDAVLLEADLQMELRDFKAAADIYQAAFDTAPNSHTAIQLAKAKQAAGSDAPFTALLQWLQRYPDDLNARMALADGYLARQQQREAIGEYEKVVDAQAVNVMALNNLAWLYQQQGDARAESTARKAYALAPSSPVIADTLGWLLLKNGKLAEATSMLADAAAKAPQQPDIQYHYAAALGNGGKTDQARERLTALLGKYQRFDARAEAEQTLAQLNSGAVKH